MQAHKSKGAAGQGGFDHGIAAVAAETHLAHQPLRLGPGQQLGPGPCGRPCQVFRQVQAMDRQVVEALHPEPFKALV